MKDANDKLQTSVRRLQLWNAILLGSVIVLSTVVIREQFAETSLVQAQAFQLLSTEGKVLAELTAEDGNPGLFLKDTNGVNRVALFHADDGTGLHVIDADGVTRIGIAQFAHGGGGVALHGPESRGAAVLYLKNEGSLRFFDSEGEVTNQVTAYKPQAED